MGNSPSARDYPADTYPFRLGTVNHSYLFTNGRARRIYTKDPAFRNTTSPTTRQDVDRNRVIISYSPMVLPT